VFERDASGAVTGLDTTDREDASMTAPSPDVCSLASTQAICTLPPACVP
jgi:hypothetical protein